MSDEISPELEAATVAFHAALDASDAVGLYHSYANELVDANSYAVVEALLAAGWRPPGVARCCDCEHILGLHDAGGCALCACAYPFGRRQ